MKIVESSVEKVTTESKFEVWRLKVKSSEVERVITESTINITQISGMHLLQLIKKCYIFNI